ncbi:MAG: hypothetical protein KC493_10175 [Bacteriovoracaceae bacterium]|nr:hypothetical protein [Bacteriovoracaceae bacterium]
MNPELSRRKLLSRTLAAGGAALIGGKALAKSCGITPDQTEGPFYPIVDQEDKSNDLTHVKGRSQRAKGEVAILKGIVQDEFCKPIQGAMVEIWQACESGKYSHPSDPNPAQLDPNFQYWGQAITNAKGEYSFKTIVPGAYPADSTWVRPPHIHFKVHLRGFEELTSQLYWKGHPLNKKDRVLQSLSNKERKLVLVDFKDINGIQVGDFNISLKSF